MIIYYIDHAQLAYFNRICSSALYNSLLSAFAMKVAPLHTACIRPYNLRSKCEKIASDIELI